MKQASNNDDNFSIEIVGGVDEVQRFHIVGQDAAGSLSAGSSEEEEIPEEIEHVCGGCGKVYKSITCLKKHLQICKRGKGESSPEKRVGVGVKCPEREREVDLVSGEATDEKEKSHTPEDPVQDEDLSGDDDNVQIQVLNDLDEESCHCCDEPLSKAHTGHIQCKHCKKKFHTYLGREKHLTNIHNSSELFKCPKCPAQCPDDDTLQQHLENHPAFVCMKCSKEFTRLYHLDRHLDKSECLLKNPEKQKTACNACGKKFLRLDNLREHLRSHVGLNYRKRDHHCETCGKSFYGLSMLQIHIRSHTNERPFACDLCEKAFPSNGALRKHRRVHTGEKPYACNFCEGRYAAKETLNRHLKTHTGVKNHKCELCDKAFIQKTQLRNHLRVYHAAKGIGCPHCAETFENKLMLKKHVTRVHQLELKCKECDEVFPTEEGLIRHHELKHSNQVFFCEDCCLNFTSKAELYEHNTIQHALPKRPSCTFCGKTYKMQDSLLKHVEREHLKQAVSATVGEEQPKIPLPKRKVGRPRKTVEVATEKRESPGGKRAKIFKESWNFLSFTENVPLKMPKMQYATEEALVKALTAIITGLFSEATQKRIDWPNCNDVEGALGKVLQLVKVTKVESEHDGVLRNSIMTLLGRFIGKRAVDRLVNNHTVDEIINYLSIRVAKTSI